MSISIFESAPLTSKFQRSDSHGLDEYLYSHWVLLQENDPMLEKPEFFL